MACIFGEHETVKKVRPPLRTMPDDGTRVVYRTVISTYPGMMPDLIALGMLKQFENSNEALCERKEEAE
jgi:hypothetical protein